MKCAALTLLIALATPAWARLGEPTNTSKPEAEASKVEATAGFSVQNAKRYNMEDAMNSSVSEMDEESLPRSELLTNISMTLNLLAADRSLMGGFSWKATTTRYGDAGASACGSVNTAELVAGTDYYNVASAQAMWGGACCWCGKSGGGGGTCGLGCFSCAKGRFLNHHGGYASGVINIIVGDLCPHTGNERWCPASPGQVNSEGAHNHLDFSRPPPGIDNNIFVFSPASCSREIRHRYEKLSHGRCR